MATSAGRGVGRDDWGRPVGGRTLGRSATSGGSPLRRIPDESRRIWLELCADEARWPALRGIHLLLVALGLSVRDVAAFRAARHLRIIEIVAAGHSRRICGVGLDGGDESDLLGLALDAEPALRRLDASELFSLVAVHREIRRASTEVETRLSRPCDRRVAISASGLAHWARELAQAEMLDTTLPGLPASRAGRALRQRSFHPGEVLRLLTPAVLELAEQGDRVIWDSYVIATRAIHDTLGLAPGSGAGRHDLTGVGDDARSALLATLAPLVVPPGYATVVSRDVEQDDEVVADGDEHVVGAKEGDER